jgi:hypothetical protein
MDAEGPAAPWRGPKLTIGFNTPLMLALFVLIGLKLAGLALASRLGDRREDRRYQRLDRPPPWIGSGSADT